MIDLINLKIPSQEEETKRLLSLISNKFYKDEGSIFYDVLSVVASDNIKKLELMKKIFYNSFVITAEKESLDLKVSELGIERKKGTKSIGKVKFIGMQGVKIPYNTVVLCDNLEYLTLFDSEISVDGHVLVEVEASNIGKQYNVKENMINKLGTPIPGVTSITNELPFEGGTNIEADVELRNRYLDKVREPATSGNAYDYKRWATSVNGIGQAKVYPLYQGPGTVKVVVISSNGTIVDENKLTEVKNVIENARPIGATVTVSNATPFIINLSVRIIKTSLVDIKTIEEEFKSIINEYIANVNLNNMPVSYGRISAILYNIKGLIDFNDLRINDETNSITVPNENIAVLGKVTLNV